MTHNFTFISKIFINTKIKVSKGPSQVSINNLGNLSRGVYFLKLVLGNEQAMYKIEK